MAKRRARKRLRAFRKEIRWSWAFYGLTAAALPLAAYSLFLLARQDLQLGQSLRLSIVWALLGLTWAATGIVSNILNIRAALPGDRVPKKGLVGPNLTSLDKVVDRVDEASALVAAIEEHQVTDVHGRKGSGKSHFLLLAADVANGHREAEAAHAPLRGLKRYSAVYLDLSEALGFDDAIAQVFRAHFPSKTASWSQLTKIIDATFRATPVLLILDNINAPGMWSALGQALYYYLSKRPNDRIVLGSIQPIRFHNLPIHGIPFGPFDAEAVTEMAAANGIALSSDGIAELQKRSDGLPLFLRLLFANWDRGADAPGGAGESVRQLLRDAIAPRLNDVSIDLFVCIALMSVTKPDVRQDDLKSLPVDSSLERLEELRAFSLVVRRHRVGRDVYKLHDLVRDAAIEVFAERISPVGQTLAAHALLKDLAAEAAVYALYAAPLGMENADTLELITNVVSDGARAKAYPLLTTLALLSETRTEVKRAMLSNPVLYNALLFARCTALAGAGDYVAATKDLEIGAARIFRTLADGGPVTQLEFDMAFLHADLVHLQNRYDEAFEAFSALRGATEQPAFAASKPRAEWALGHVLRHQGRSLDDALSHFDKALSFAEEIEDLPTIVSSTTGRTTIDILMKRAGGETLSRLDALQARLESAPTSANFLPKIWKSQSQLAFMNGDSATAHRLIGKCVAHALENNDRLLFNYYFERAEFHRLDGHFAASIDDYGRVLEYGRENGDRNLISNALLGIVEAELSDGRFLHHKSSADMRASVLQARAIALDADIQITVQQAELTLAKLEGSAGDRTRLFLF